MALTHPLHPINSRSRNKHRNLDPFSTSYLEAQVTWNFPQSHLIVFYPHFRWLGSQMTSIADLGISWVTLTSLFGTLYLFKFMYVTPYGMFYNICTKGSQNYLYWSFEIHVCDTIWHVLQYMYKGQSELSLLINYVFDATGSDGIVGSICQSPWVAMVLHSVTLLLVWHVTSQ